MTQASHRAESAASPPSSASLASSLLLNPLATIEQLPNFGPPDDPVPLDLQLDLRAYGAQLIHRLGQLLELPQRLTATAQIIFQRFWFVTSFSQFGCLDIAVAAIFVGSKSEEWPIKLRDLINCWDYLVQRDRWLSDHEKEDIGTPFVYSPHTYHSSTFYSLKDSLVVHEMQLLKRLGFQLEAQLPYSTLVNYLNVLGLGREKEIVQRCWAVCSDMLQTPLPALFPPHTLSLAAIYFLSLPSPSIIPPLPRQPHPWWTLFDVTLDELRIVGSWLVRLYDTGQGTASRLKEKRGGMIRLGTKEEVRNWLEQRKAERYSKRKQS